jgi:AcrR family transcriptional regulator
MEVQRGRAEVPQTIRSRATHERITTALVRLVESGLHHPAANDVAHGADVSLRTIFHHFHDLDQMYSAALAAKARDARVGLTPIDTASELMTRCDAISLNRDATYAALAPMLRAYVANPNRALQLSSHIEHEALLTAMQAQTRDTFAVELRQHEDPLKALLVTETALSFAVWDYLHRVQGVSRSGTRQFMSALTLSIMRSFGA